MEGKTLEKIVLVMADQHVPHLSERMEKITLKVAETYKRKITDVIFLGDGVDNPAMSVFPERPDNDSLLQGEIDAFVQHAEKYRAIVPSASMYYINGNHCKGRLDRVKNLNRSLAGLRNLQFESLIKEAASKYAPKLQLTFADTLRKYGINFTHGDRRIDPYVKEGVHGTVNTARLYPREGDIVSGHKHIVEQAARPLGDSAHYVVGAMFDLKEIAEQYKSCHGYQNGFMIIHITDGKKQFDNLLVTDAPFIYQGIKYA